MSALLRRRWPAMSKGRSCARTDRIRACRGRLESRVHRRSDRPKAVRGRMANLGAMLGAVMLAAVVLNVAAGGAADAAIVTSQASLVDGQLTIVGSGAVPHSTVIVDGGLPTGTADTQGDFSISASDFSEPSCVATLFDGSVTVEVTLSGCTATISPPPVPPGVPSLVGPPRGASTPEPFALSWDAPTGSTGLSYRWQVSSHSSFASLVQTAITNPKVTATTLSGLAFGTYYWRVQSVKFPPDPYNPLFGEWSPVRTVTITGEAAGTPGRPSLTKPVAGSEYHPVETFPLTWTSSLGASSYLLQMAPNATFAPGTLLADVTEMGTTARAPLFDFQTGLYVRVFGVSGKGILGLPSPTVGLQITYKAPVPPAPMLLSPAEGATTLLPVTLKWTADPNPQVEGYQLEISNTSSFAGGCGDIEECVSGLSQPQDTLFSLPSGVHYWRVQSSHGLAGPHRAAVTAWSAVRSFTVSDAPPEIQSVIIDVFSGGGVVLRSHTHVYSGTNEDNEAFGIVQLTTPAPTGGEAIHLSSTSPSVASLPSSVTVPPGQAQESFQIQPEQVTRATKVVLSAALNDQSDTAPLTVDPARLNQVFIESNEKIDGHSLPNFISGGTDLVGTMLFNGNAPSGSVVTMASSSPAATVPARVSAAGQGVSFTITTREVTTSTPVILTVTWRDRTVSAKMTLQPPPILVAPAPGASFASGHVVIFRWHTPAGLSSQLQVADNPAFKNPVTDLDTDTAQAWAVESLPSGTLYWRVLGVDIYGNEGPPPAARTFTVRAPTGPFIARVLKCPTSARVHGSTAWSSFPTASFIQALMTSMATSLLLTEWKPESRVLLRWWTTRRRR
jgi:hypothetical protein